MATPIGYNDGIAAEYNRLRDLDPGGTILKKDSKGHWLSLNSLDAVPLDSWKAYDKAERRARILKDDHDAALAGGGSPNPPEPPDPAASYVKVAPRVAYKAGSSDARYCLRDFPHLQDEVASYDSNGLCTSGTRSDGSPADCPTSALEIDQREYCDLPTQGDPLKNTGSWKI